jgi:hypothetical protein
VIFVKKNTFLYLTNTYTDTDTNTDNDQLVLPRHLDATFNIDKISDGIKMSIPGIGLLLMK